MAPIVRTQARVTFTADGDASALVYAFQAARLAVVAEVADRVGGGKVAVDRPAPGMLIVTAYSDEMAAILAELEKAQVYAPVLLDVSTDEELTADDYAEYLRDRTGGVVVIARPAVETPSA